MNTPGFKLYKSLLDDQRRMRVQEIVGKDSHSLDELIAVGSMKSELAGIQFAGNLPQMMVETLEDEIKSIIHELEDYEDEE